jgi:hypothetical protein
MPTSFKCGPMTGSPHARQHATIPAKLSRMSRLAGEVAFSRYRASESGTNSGCAHIAACGAIETVVATVNTKKQGTCTTR